MHVHFQATGQTALAVPMNFQDQLVFPSSTNKKIKDVLKRNRKCFMKILDYLGILNKITTSFNSCCNSLFILDNLVFFVFKSRILAWSCSSLVNGLKANKF